MRFVVWVLIAYAAGALPLPEQAQRRFGRGELMQFFVGAAPVLAAVRLAGPYEAAATAIAVVAGRAWPVLRPRSRPLTSCAAGALLVLLPFEALAGLACSALVRFVGRNRVWPALAVVVVPVVATLRGQPAPYRIAAVAAALMLLAHRAEGAASPGAALRRLVAADGGAGA